MSVLDYPFNFGKRLERFAMRPMGEDRTVNILEGSVRSGKTWAMFPKILTSPFYPVAGWRILTGVTKEAVYRNLLNDLFTIIGKGNYNYNRQSGFLRMLGQDWMVIGAQDEGSEKMIRGMTVGLALCDEITLMPQSFYNMLYSRLSPAGSRLYGTTNTDNPLHWFKTDILENAAMRAAGDLFSMHCTMDDNPNLTEKYKDGLKRYYKGLFYKRFILGLWTMAQGVIYGDVWNDKSTFLDSDLPVGFWGPGGTMARCISIDYGTTNPCVFLDWRDDGEVAWCVDEWRWDSKEQMRAMTDSQYVQALTEWLKGDKSPRLILDPSAASLRAELNAAGYWVTNADNEVLEGIQKTSTAISRNVIRFHRDRCKATISEFMSYSWDPKKTARGLDEPIKSNDHGPDSGRYYVETCIPAYRLQDAA